MGKLLDSISIGVALFILAFIVSVEASHNSIFSLVISTSLSLIIIISINKIMSNKHDKVLSSKNFDTYMIIKGLAYVLDALEAIYPEYTRHEKCLVHDDIMIAPLFKFSAISRDDVLKLYNDAKALSVSSIYIISNNIDRQTINFSHMLYDMHFSFVRSHELYKIVHDRSLLPTIPKRPPRKNMPVRTLLGVLFSRSNVPRYLLTSLLLLAIGLLTPLRNYYLTMSGVSSLMALASIFVTHSPITRTKLPPYKKKDSSHM